MASVSVPDPDYQSTLDVDSDPDFQARLNADMDNFLRFATESALSTVDVDEIMNDSSDYNHHMKLKEEEALHNELRSLVPTFFKTRDARRKEAADLLRWAAKPRADYPVAKACTWSCGEQLLTETWLGITWVALQRKDESICIVVRNRDLLDLERELVQFRDGHPIMRFLERFWNAIISHIEDTKEHVFGSSSSVQSFSVVAVGAANKDPETLTEAMNFAEKTSKFFLEKLKSDPSLTSEETVQTAIMASQYLFDQEFEPEEIRVFLWEKEQIIAEEVLLKPEDLDLDLGLDLEEMLACIDADNDDSGMHGSKRQCLGAAARFS